jgi:MOSC domain-containing protein YiiM
VSLEELQEISDAVNLRHTLLPSTLGANLCLEGVNELSRLPKDRLLKFPSGAELSVEEFNPPCHDMGTRLAATHKTRDGEEISTTAFSNAARRSRGLVGVVEVPGEIRPGDEVTIEVYEHPGWLQRSDD